MTIAQEIEIRIDGSREITVRISDKGAVTLTVEDPQDIAIVEIPPAKMKELIDALRIADLASRSPL